MRPPTITEKMKGHGLAEWETQAVSIKDPPFKARGDGITDDKAAIQGAFDSGASHITIPSGHYHLKSPVTLPTKRGCVIVGMGESSLIFGDFAGKLFEIQADRTQIRSLGFAGGAGITDCVYADSFHRGELYDITIHRCGGDAIHFRNCYMWTIFRFKSRWDNEGVKTSYPRVSKGIHLTVGASNCNAINIFDPLIEEATDAIYSVGSQDVKVWGGVLENNLGYAFYANGGNKYGLDGTYFENNRDTSGDAKSLAFENVGEISLRDLKMGTGEGVYCDTVTRFTQLSGGIPTLELVGVCREFILLDFVGEIIGLNNLITGTDGLNIYKDPSDGKFYFIKEDEFRIGGNETGSAGAIEFDDFGVSMRAGGNKVLGVGGGAKILVNNANNSITYGTTVPSSGVRVAGDKHWKTNAAAGGLPGWVCVTGGDPGTWKAMADLAV